MKLLKYALILVVLPLSGCLRNLNVTEFFRKLEIKNESYFEIVSANQTAIEALIKEELELNVEGDIIWITFWGESRYACGDVVTELSGEEYVVVPGEFRLEGEERTFLYTVWFIPSNENLLGEVELVYY